MIKLPLTFLLEISKGLLDVTTIGGSHCLFICRYKNLITLVDISNLSVHTIYSGNNCGLVLDVEYQKEPFNSLPNLCVNVFYTEDNSNKCKKFIIRDVLDSDYIHDSNKIQDNIYEVPIPYEFELFLNFINEPVIELIHKEYAGAHRGVTIHTQSYVYKTLFFMPKEGLEGVQLVYRRNKEQEEAQFFFLDYTFNSLKVVQLGSGTSLSLTSGYNILYQSVYNINKIPIIASNIYHHIKKSIKRGVIDWINF
jgi:hypothetical protein